MAAPKRGDVTPKMAILRRKPTPARRRSTIPILLAWGAMIAGYYAGQTDDIGSRIWLLSIGSAAVYAAVAYARFDELDRHR